MTFSIALSDDAGVRLDAVRAVLYCAEEHYVRHRGSSEVQVVQQVLWEETCGLGEQLTIERDGEPTVLKAEMPEPERSAPDSRASGSEATVWRVRFEIERQGHKRFEKHLPLWRGPLRVGLTSGFTDETGSLP